MANFKIGINRIKHTYPFKLSESVEMEYDFDYVLTAATRRANKQIDDFTRTIQMGDYEDFYINNTVTGKKGYRHRKNPAGARWCMLFTDKSYSRYLVQKGAVYFHQLNFKPVDEISLFAKNGMIREDPFDYKTGLERPFSINRAQFISVKTANPASLKILKNLPFARRGFVFKDPFLKWYFEKSGICPIGNINPAC